MSDRRRLLLYSVLILAVASFTTMAVAIFHVGHALQGRSAGVESGNYWNDYGRAICLSLAESAAVIIAGGTLLLRATNPFMRRLEQSENHTRTILNTAGDGIITLDVRGEMMSCNLAAERMFGRSAAEMIGQSIEQIVQRKSKSGGTDFEGHGEADGTIVDHLITGQSIVGLQRDGVPFPLEHSISRFYWNERVLYTAILRDVTERVVAEQWMREHVFMLHEAKKRLEDKAAELAKINRELDDFTHIASHDLKEPLRGISSYCQILLEDYGDKLDQDGRRRLDALVGLCQRLGHLIDDLLAYSQIGRTQPRQQEVDFNEAVVDVLDMLGPSIEQRRAMVRIAGRLPVMTADRTMVGEIFRNLITNGLKFNESERPAVEIGCIESEPPTLYVRDNGIGIPEQHHGAVFTMFRRLHGRHKYEGTGAGLSLVRKIVEAHGGQVWIDSQLGCGSTFHFTLSPGDSCARQELALGAAD